MIIAVIIGALLMPAQVSAQNVREKRGDKKVQVDKKKNDKKVMNNKGKGKPVVNGKGKNAPVVHVHRPAPRPAVVIHEHRPAPRPVPVHRPRPVVVHEHCNSGAIGATAVVVGAAALMSLLVN